MFDTQNNAFRKLFEEGKKYINLQIIKRIIIDI